ncbi:MAG: hypothetical protein D6719_07615 [Candidatus Dadabacteria bacterium]|nr:MAG: hypothetical protein D6719_07615 [Candidatus Dadabacteria bacterium]
MSIKLHYLYILFFLGCSLSNQLVVAQGCDDYAARQLGNRWDMAESIDVDAYYPRHIQYMSNIMFSGGKVSFDTSSTAAEMRLLSTVLWSSQPTLGAGNFGQLHPINTTRYNKLAIRLRLNNPNTLRVKAYAGLSYAHYILTTKLPLSAGWNTLVIDLNSTPISYANGSTSSWADSPKTGLTILPTSTSPGHVEVDWVRLYRDGNCDNPTTDLSPLFNFIEPGPDGGRAVIASNFDTPNDVIETQHLSQADIIPHCTVGQTTGDFLYGLSSSNDPIVWTMFPSRPGSKTIDTNVYKIASWRLMLVHPVVDVDAGSVMRIICKSGDSYNESDDIVALPDNGFAGNNWGSYYADITKLQKETGGPTCTGIIDGIRIDPHEFSTPLGFYLDFFHLKALDTANRKFTIAYSVSDDKPLAGTTIDLYYTTSNKPENGTLITAGLPAGSNTRTYTWDTSSVAEGTYYIYAIVNDGTNSVPRISPRPVVIDHNYSDDTAPPEMAIKTPLNNEGFVNQLNVSGYAYDDIDLALVEILVDGALIDSFVPSELDLTARKLHPNWVEASNAGFSKSYDLSSLPDGAHTLKVVATDTGGNSSVSEISVNKGPGLTQTVPEITPPDCSTLPAGMLTPEINRVWRRGRGLEAKIRGFGWIAGCTVSVFSGTTKDTQSDLLGSFNITAEDAQINETRFNIRSLPALPSEIKPYLRAEITCSDYTLSTAPKKLRLRKGRATYEKWLKKARRKFAYGKFQKKKKRRKKKRRRRR